MKWHDLLVYGFQRNVTHLVYVGTSAGVLNAIHTIGRTEPWGPYAKMREIFEKDS